MAVLEKRRKKEMSVSKFDELLEHVGHKIVCTAYTSENKEEIVNVAIECEDCNEVIIDYDKEEEC